MWCGVVWWWCGVGTGASPVRGAQAPQVFSATLADSEFKTFRRSKATSIISFFRLSSDFVTYTRQAPVVGVSMIDENPDTQQKQSMRKLRAQICSLTYELLSTSDYPESLQIATDLIAAIHTLLEARSQSD